MTRIADLATHRPHVTVDELAEYLNVHPDTIYKAIRCQVIKAVKVGVALRIPADEARRYAGIGQVNARA